MNRAAPSLALAAGLVLVATVPGPPSASAGPPPCQIGQVLVSGTAARHVYKFQRLCSAINGFSDLEISAVYDVASRRADEKLRFIPADRRSNLMTATVSNPRLEARHYKSSLKPIWCPGCGDFGVLAAAYRAFAELDLDPDRTVIVSGIGCSSRFPGFVTTYGFHGVARGCCGKLRQRARVQLGNALLQTQSFAPWASRNSTMSCLPPVSARSIARC